MVKKRGLRSVYTSMLALLLALILSLTLMPNAQAVLAIANPEFGTYPSCSLSSWTTTGNVAALSVASGSTTIGIPVTNECVAKVEANSSNNISTLSQTINVPSGSGTNAQRLNFSVWPKSSNGACVTTNGYYTYNSQRIALYNSQDVLIYMRSRNVTSNNYTSMYFSYDLSAYAGQNVTVKITTNITPGNPQSPTYATIYADSFYFGTYVVVYGGGGEFSW